jgi:hypothetical protein
MTGRAVNPTPGETRMADATIPAGKYMVDSYLDWARNEGVPIHEGFGLDLLAVATRPWPRCGVNGAIVHVKGRGDNMSVFLLDLPPGAQTAPQKQRPRSTSSPATAARWSSATRASAISSNGDRAACLRRR